MTRLGSQTQQHSLYNRPISAQASHHLPISHSIYCSVTKCANIVLKRFTAQMGLINFIIEPFQ